MAKIVCPYTVAFQDYPDPEAHSIVVSFSGCKHNCAGCHNHMLANENYMFACEYDLDEFYGSLSYACLTNRTNFVCFQGGEPLYESNREFVKKFLEQYGNHFKICLYTGYSVDEVKSFGISGFDFLKCGKFEIDKIQYSEKTDEYFQLGSWNQELYDKDFNLVSDKGRYVFPSNK